MPTYLTKIEATYYYRRPVPPALQRFFLTRNGKPKTEWMESLRTKDRRAAEQALHRRNVEVDELIREAEARLAAMRADPAERRRAQAEREEFEAREEAAHLMYLETFEEDEAMLAREPQRRAIIERLRKPKASMFPFSPTTCGVQTFGYHFRIEPANGSHGLPTKTPRHALRLAPPSARRGSIGSAWNSTCTATR